MGVPIISPSGTVEASISIAAPIMRFNEERKEAMAAALMRAAREVAASMPTA